MNSAYVIRDYAPDATSPSLQASRSISSRHDAVCTRVQAASGNKTGSVCDNEINTYSPTCGNVTNTFGVRRVRDFHFNRNNSSDSSYRSDQSKTCGVYRNGYRLTAHSKNTCDGVTNRGKVLRASPPSAPSLVANFDRSIAFSVRSLLDLRKGMSLTPTAKHRKRLNEQKPTHNGKSCERPTNGNDTCSDLATDQVSQLKQQQQQYVEEDDRTLVQKYMRRYSQALQLELAEAAEVVKNSAGLCPSMNTNTPSCQVHLRDEHAKMERFADRARGSVPLLLYNDLRCARSRSSKISSSEHRSRTDRDDHHNRHLNSNNNSNGNDVSDIIVSDGSSRTGVGAATEALSERSPRQSHFNSPLSTPSTNNSPVANASSVSPSSSKARLVNVESCLSDTQRQRLCATQRVRSWKEQSVQNKMLELTQYWLSLRNTRVQVRKVIKEMLHTATLVEKEKEHGTAAASTTPTTPAADTAAGIGTVGGVEKDTQAHMQNSSSVHDEAELLTSSTVATTIDCKCSDDNDADQHDNYDQHHRHDKDINKSTYRIVSDAHMCHTASTIDGPCDGEALPHSGHEACRSAINNGSCNAGQQDGGKSSDCNDKNECSQSCGISSEMNDVSGLLLLAVSASHTSTPSSASITQEKDTTTTAPTIDGTQSISTIVAHAQRNEEEQQQTDPPPLAVPCVAETTKSIASSSDNTIDAGLTSAESVCGESGEDSYTCASCASCASHVLLGSNTNTIASFIMCANNIEKQDEHAAPLLAGTKATAPMAPTISVASATTVSDAAMCKESDSQLARTILSESATVLDKSGKTVPGAELVKKDDAKDGTRSRQSLSVVGVQEVKEQEDEGNDAVDASYDAIPRFYYPRGEPSSKTEVLSGPLWRGNYRNPHLVIPEGCLAVTGRVPLDADSETYNNACMIQFSHRLGGGLGNTRGAANTSSQHELAGMVSSLRTPLIESSVTGTAMPDAHTGELSSMSTLRCIHDSCSVMSYIQKEFGKYSLLVRYAHSHKSSHSSTDKCKTNSTATTNNNHHHDSSSGNNNAVGSSTTSGSRRSRSVFVHPKHDNSYRYQLAQCLQRVCVHCWGLPRYFAFVVQQIMQAMLLADIAKAQSFCNKNNNDHHGSTGHSAKRLGMVGGNRDHSRGAKSRTVNEDDLKPVTAEGADAVSNTAKTAISSICEQAAPVKVTWASIVELARAAAAVLSNGHPTCAVVTASYLYTFYEKHLRGKGSPTRIFDLLILSSAVLSCLPECADVLSGGSRGNSNCSHEPKTHNAQGGNDQSNSSSDEYDEITCAHRNYLVRSDFLMYMTMLLRHHPGLSFLRSTREFQERYVQTVVFRVFYDLDRLHCGQISLTTFAHSRLIDAFRQVDATEDINTVMLYFSYEHFYVLYCRFWEIDSDHDMLLTLDDLARYTPDYLLDPLIVQRVFAGVGCPLHCTEPGYMDYEDFMYFCLSEEDKSTPAAIRYWFRILDLDEDGVLSLFELHTFLAAVESKVKQCINEMVSHQQDVVCQVFDMLRVPHSKGLTLGDMLREPESACVAINLLTNVMRFVQFEQRDPFVAHADRLLGGSTQCPWDRFAQKEYNRMSLEVDD